MTGQDLPLPDYDQLPVAGLEHRIRPLAGDDVRRLLDYERAHANRPQVVEMLTARLRQLDAGAEPSSGDPEAEHSDRPEAARGGSPVSPDSSAEPSPPLRHGVHDV
ncbi:hypothetical protein DVA86_11950 [Streptomyces armeniacus]|uniref:DUF8129 domain-containing protein n=1 Tax=Streptomyces armeniacus TaxID=83291 RepID=A0A345XNP3_9ACTN|nr:hypothetical protein [Streptomyces armeniacus]AXK33259.1 hypothetical protein DVA86_11950 [Streptomyces armeniacus]